MSSTLLSLRAGVLDGFRALSGGDARDRTGCCDWGVSAQSSAVRLGADTISARAIDVRAILSDLSIDDTRWRRSIALPAAASPINSEGAKKDCVFYAIRPASTPPTNTTANERSRRRLIVAPRAFHCPAPRASPDKWQVVQSDAQASTCGSPLDVIAAGAAGSIRLL
jgi:hypothetical protein